MLNRLCRHCFLVSSFLILVSNSVFSQQKKPAGFQGNRFHLTLDYNMTPYLKGAPVNQLEKLEKDLYEIPETARFRYFFIGQLSASLDYMLNRRTAVFAEYGAGKFFFADRFSLGSNSSFEEQYYDQLFSDLNLPVFQKDLNLSNSNSPDYYWGDILNYHSTAIGLRLFNELGPISWSCDVSYAPTFFATQSNLNYLTSTVHFWRVGFKTSKVLFNNFTGSISGNLAVSKYVSSLAEIDNPISTDPGYVDISRKAGQYLQQLMLFRARVGVGYLF